MKVALFGGTFDPIHLAHTRVAAEAADLFSLDQVLFVPSAHPPHKQAGGTTAYAHRLAMTRLATLADPRFAPSDLESADTPSYSFHTIRRAQAALAPSDQLFFLIGADAFAEIASWHRSADVLAAVDFLVVSRPGYSYPIPPNARVHRLESLALVISSSEIRRKLDSGEPVPELDPAVLAYIRQHRLYE